MIQVKEHGNRYRLYKTTCSECKCKFTFAPIDRKRVYMCGGMIDCGYIKCPECGKDIAEWEINTGYQKDEEEPLLHIKMKIHLLRILSLAKEHNDTETEQIVKQLFKEEFDTDIEE